VLKFDLQEKEIPSTTKQGPTMPRQELITESVLVTRVSKLTHDGSTVGPGDYDVDQAYRANRPQPRGSVTLAVDRTKRLDPTSLNRAARLVGPGSYEVVARSEKDYQRNTIPRASRASAWTQQQKKKKKNSGSIRADFEESGSESEYEGEQLGPGHYLQDFHTSTFGSEPILHDHPQKFGSVVGRFREPGIERNRARLGPGQYLSQNMLPKFAPKKGKEE
jgi:hypothetical protein